MGRIVDLWHNKDRTRTARYGAGQRWQAVWSENGDVRKKSFQTKDAAAAHLTWVQHHQLSGTYVSADRGRVFVKDLLPKWAETLVHLKASTLSTTKYDIDATLLPAWGNKVLADITRADVQTWVSGMGKAARTVDTIYGRFNTFLKWCVEEQYLRTNPATGVNLPRGHKREHIFLTVEQVTALAEAIGDSNGDLIWLLATTGLRMGEACELRTKDVDLRRRRLNIARAVTEAGGRLVIGTPKNGSARTVPLTPSMVDTLRVRIKGRDREDLLFTTARGRQIRANNFKRRDYDDAVAKVNADAARRKATGRTEWVRIPSGLWVHDLRHTAASWAVQSGASVKSVQRMLGHATAAITLDTYAGLFDQDLDDVAARMDALIRPKSATGTDTAA